MKVVLIQPYDARRPYYARIPSVGLGYAAAAARESGASVVFIDAVRQRFEANALRARLETEKPDVVGITFFSPDYSAVRDTAATAASLSPRPVIALGGPHPTFETQATLKEFPDADVLFLAEAEDTFSVFLRALQESGNAHHAARKTPGTAFTHESEIIINTAPPPVDVNRLPTPAWDLIEPETYPAAPNGIFSRHACIAPVIATRGCRYNCAFCAVGRMQGHTVRTRNPLNIVDEITLLKNRGVREIHFMDDSFTQNREFVMSFCDTLERQGMRMPWSCPNGIRLDTLDGEMLRAMERAGCYSFAVGIESGTQRILDEMGKGINIDTIREKIGLIKDNTHIRVTGFFVLGFPGETIGDIENTIEFAMSLPIERANFFNFTPFPGSRVYEKLKLSGELKDVDLSSLYIHEIVYAPEGVERETLAGLQRRAHLMFYLRLKILLGIAAEIKSFSQLGVVIRRAFAVLMPKKRHAA